MPTEQTPEQKLYKCSQILSNQMQCPRYAIFRQADDLIGKYALCGICYTLNLDKFAGHGYMPIETLEPVDDNTNA